MFKPVISAFYVPVLSVIRQKDEQTPAWGDGIGAVFGKPTFTACFITNWPLIFAIRQHLKV